MPRYPLPEELPLLARLPTLLAAEAAHPGTAREAILVELAAQERLRTNSLLSSILFDVAALLHAPRFVDGDMVPIETPEGTRAPDRAARIQHILTRLDRYVASEPAETFAPTLYRGAVARLRFEGAEIAVDEISRPAHCCTLVRAKSSGAYYLEYLVSQSFAMWTEVHQLTPAETAALERGALDLAALCNRLPPRR